VGDTDNIQESDKAVQDILFERLNIYVEMADDADDPAQLLREFHMVVISSSVDPATLAGKYTSARRPVVVMHAGAFSAMGMTGSQPEESGTSPATDIFITAEGAANPIGLGFLGALKVSRVNIPLNFGVPAAGATVLATLDDSSDRAAIFGYLPGDTMSTMVAPHTRVGFLSDRYGRLTADGRLLFERAIMWAAKVVVLPPDGCSAF
jgi:hypothetical protein